MTHYNKQAHAVNLARILYKAGFFTRLQAVEFATFTYKHDKAMQVAVWIHQSLFYGGGR